MNRFNRLFSMLSYLSDSKLAITIFISLIPAFILMSFGLYLTIKHNYLVHLSLALLTSTLLVLLFGLVHRIISKPANIAQQTESSQANLVQPSPDWSQTEQKIWQDTRQSAKNLLEKNDEWNNIPQQ